MSALRVAVVVVTHNSATVLAPCLDSLADAADHVRLTDVVVVDNASDDDSTEIAKAATGLPVTVVQLTDNAGYAAGINAGIASLATRPPDAVMIVNPDCRVRPGALGVLMRALAEPGCGIAGPRMVNPDGTLQPTLRRRPTVLGAFGEAVLGGRLSDRLGVGELVFGERPHRRPGPAVWLMGATLLMSWTLLAAVGPWDESFLLYSEETEYILRAADLGWITWYEPAAVVEHIGGESGTHPGLAALLAVNKVRLFRRREGRVAGSLYAAAVTLGMLVRAIAGQSTARASLAALLLPSRRIRSLDELR